MGNIIFDCDKETIITNKEVNISINKRQTWKKDENKFKLLITSIQNFYINSFFKKLKNYKKEDNISIIIPNNIIGKNQQESIVPSNMDNNTLNSSMNKKYIEEDTQIIDNQNNNNFIINPSNAKNETPDGNNLIIQSNSPPKEEPKPQSKPITKIKKKKKKSPQKTNLTPIPEYPTSSVVYDKSLMPGDLIFNFKDIPQTDKITEIENNIGGEFFIEEKELLKCMEEYPYMPKSFSIRYPSGENYSGYYSPNWVKEVFGIQIDKNGSKYVGMFKNGMFEGRGRLILHKGDYYEGEFVENKANGLGKYVNAKGEIYNGSWVDDKQEGEGELILKDGSIYQGEFKNGKKYGKGRITWNDGNGKFTYDNGVVYEGEFSKGRFHGKGTLIYPNGGKFTGDWVNGKLVEGSGKYEFADGLKFEEPNKWDFCTYKDRRFYHEHLHGVDNPKIEKYAKKLFRPIPEGCYDTGDGYYNPEKGTVFTYENVYLREPNEEEEEWIKLKCRYNPKQEMERLDKFHAETNERFTDEEVYELMEKYKNDDEAILNELKDQLKEIERGAEYDWQEIGKSN